MSYTLADFTNFGVEGPVQTVGFRPELIAVPAGSYYINSAYGSGPAAQLPSGSYNGVTAPAGLTYNVTTTGDASPPSITYPVTSTTAASYTQAGKTVTFDVSIDLDRSKDLPTGAAFAGNNELRVRTLSGVGVNSAIGGAPSVKGVVGSPPNSLYQALPPADPRYGTPVFKDVQILYLDPTTKAFWTPVPTLLPSGGQDLVPVVSLVARLLADGSLALAQQYPLNNNDPYPNQPVTGTTPGGAEQAIVAATLAEADMFGVTNSGFVRLVVRGAYRSF